MSTIAPISGMEVPGLASSSPFAANRESSTKGLLAPTLRAGIRSLLIRWSTLRLHRRATADLENMSDRLLRDIGVARAETARPLRTVTAFHPTY